MKRSEPLYKSIAGQLASNIKQGTYAKGSRLPNESELCREFGVSRITIRQAIQILVEQELVKRVQGSGTYVTHSTRSQRSLMRSSKIIPFNEEMRAAGIKPTSRVLTFEMIDADAPLADELSLASGAAVTLYERVLYGDKKPIMLEWGYMPVERFPDFSVATLRASKTAYIEETQGYKIDYTYVTVEAVGASSRQAELLDIEAGTPLLKQTQIVFDDEDVPIEKTISVFSTDTYKAHYMKMR